MKFIISNNPKNHQETYHVFYIRSRMTSSGANAECPSFMDNYLNYVVVALSEKDAQIAFLRYNGFSSESPPFRYLSDSKCVELKPSDIIDFNIFAFYADDLIDQIAPTLNGNRGKVVALRGDGLYCDDHFYWVDDHFYWVEKGLNEVQNEN